MITIPYEDIIKKIIEKTSLSQADVDEKIKAKMNQLSGLISKEGAAHIIANENGVILVEQTTGRLDIAKILPGMRSVEVVGKVTAIYEVREFESKGRKGKVGSFMVGDATGSIRIVAWGDKADILGQLKNDDVVKVSDAYVKDNQGRKELHLNDRAKVDINPSGEKVDNVAAPAARPDATRKSIKDLTESDANAEILGTVVQVFDPRFFEKCPACNKRARLREDKYVCEQHGVVETPNYSYVLNVFLDDGSDNIRVVFFGEQVLSLISKKHEDMLLYRADPTKFDEVKTEMLGQVIKVGGRTVKNEMFDRLELIANRVDSNPDPEKELERMP